MRKTIVLGLAVLGISAFASCDDQPVQRVPVPPPTDTRAYEPIPYQKPYQVEPPPPQPAPAQPAPAQPMQDPPR